MVTPVLATKLYLPPPRPGIVLRPRLAARLDEGLSRRLTLISAAAGFGKTTLVSEWVAGCGRPVAWLSLDQGDNDPLHFLAYLATAVQTIAARQEASGEFGAGVLRALQSPRPPPTETILTALLNEVAGLPEPFILVLDDYHVIEAQAVDKVLVFMLEHLPPRMHLIIATREDPALPLARLRARGQLCELRAADLRFTPAEAAEFLNRVMGLGLSADEVAALETRTEGWIAGLQLAALALQGTVSTTGRPDAASFIQSFTGSHHFVLDYLIEEVLGQQSTSIQAFLLRTSILERMCGSLCDAVLRDPAIPGQSTLEYIERANLFVVPLDNQRGWYRYHHLFGELLRQRLRQEAQTPPGSRGDLAAVGGVADYHLRASQWFEDNGLDLEAFQHAVAANDVDRAARLVEGAGMPLHFRGAAVPVLRWLESLSQAELDARPALWVMYASALLFVSQLAGVEHKLQAAEAAFQGIEQDGRIRDLIGHIASVRATLAVTRHQADEILAQSRRALKYLHPNNLPVRTATTWTMGHAYHLQGDRAAAAQAYTEAIVVSQAIGHFIIHLMATLGLAAIQETGNQLPQAAETYRRGLELAGDPPIPVACEAHLGLARISYEWNDLDAARQHGQQAARLAQQLESTDRFVACQVFLGRLLLAQGDDAGSAAILTRAEQLARQGHFANQLPEIAAVRALALLRQGDLGEAASLAATHAFPILQARVHLARGEAPAALAILEQLSQQVEARDWQDERLKVIVLQALAWQARDDRDQALALLDEALALAEPGGFIRLFLDEGAPMAQLLSAAAAGGVFPDYTGRLLAAFEADRRQETDQVAQAPVQPLIEPLSPRELEVLKLIAQGLSNSEISGRLFLSLNTVKGHNRKIFDKLQVQRRTEAIARGRELGLIQR